MCIIIPRATTKKIIQRYSQNARMLLVLGMAQQLPTGFNSSAEDIIQKGSYLISLNNEENQANSVVKYTTEGSSTE